MVRRRSLTRHAATGPTLRTPRFHAIDQVRKALLDLRSPRTFNDRKVRQTLRKAFPDLRREDPEGLAQASTQLGGKTNGPEETRDERGGRCCPARGGAGGGTRPRPGDVGALGWQCRHGRCAGRGLEREEPGS